VAVGSFLCFQFVGSDVVVSMKGLKQKIII